MNELIAKRYVKALMELFNKEELKVFSDSLSKVSALYDIEKFQLIIQSPDVSKDEKVDIILSTLEKSNEKFTNLIKLLNENDRLLLIPYLDNELKTQVLQMENIHKGRVLANFDMVNADVQKLQDSFSKKFGAKVELECKKTDYPGIKIELDTLGVEASFSLERLKAQIAEHILKAI